MNRSDTLKHIESLEGTARWLKNRLSEQAYKSRLAFLEAEANKARKALYDFIESDGPAGRPTLATNLQVTEEEIAANYRKLAEEERRIEAQRNEVSPPKARAGPSKDKLETAREILRKFKAAGIPQAQLEQAAAAYGLKLSDL